MRATAQVDAFVCDSWREQAAVSTEIPVTNVSCIVTRTPSELYTRAESAEAPAAAPAAAPSGGKHLPLTAIMIACAVGGGALVCVGAAALVARRVWKKVGGLGIVGQTRMLASPAGGERGWHHASTNWMGLLVLCLCMPAWLLALVRMWGA